MPNVQAPFEQKYACKAVASKLQLTVPCPSGDSIKPKLLFTISESPPNPRRRLARCTQYKSEVSNCNRWRCSASPDSAESGNNLLASGAP